MLHKILQKVLNSFSFQSVQNMFTKLAELHYSSFEGTLRSGSLSDTILLYPPPRVSCANLEICQIFVLNANLR